MKGSRSSTCPTERSSFTSEASSRSRRALRSRTDDSSMAYTPGVARVSSAIAADPAKVWALTIKQNTVAIVSLTAACSDSATSSRRRLCPSWCGEASLRSSAASTPFRSASRRRTSTRSSATGSSLFFPVFGGVNLEDISAPRCFEVERRLREILHIQVPPRRPARNRDRRSRRAAERSPGRRQGPGKMSDRPHGRRRGGCRDDADVTAGAGTSSGRDREVLYRGRPGLTPGEVPQRWISTNPRDLRSSADDALEGADVAIFDLARRSELRCRPPQGHLLIAAKHNHLRCRLSEIENHAAIYTVGPTTRTRSTTARCSGRFRGALDRSCMRDHARMWLAAARGRSRTGRPTKGSHMADYIIPSGSQQPRRRFPPLLHSC